MFDRTAYTLLLPITSGGQRFDDTTVRVSNKGVLHDMRPQLRLELRSCGGGGSLTILKRLHAVVVVNEQLSHKSCAQDFLGSPSPALRSALPWTLVAEDVA